MVGTSRSRWLITSTSVENISYLQTTESAFPAPKWAFFAYLYLFRPFWSQRSSVKPSPFSNSNIGILLLMEESIVDKPKPCFIPILSRTPAIYPLGNFATAWFKKTQRQPLDKFRQKTVYLYLCIFIYVFSLMMKRRY